MSEQTQDAASEGARPRLGGAVVLALIGLLVVSLGCIRVERQVEVTPGAIPESIEGARWRSLPVAYCVVPDDAGFVEPERFASLVDQAFAQRGVEVSSEGECDELVEGNGRNEIGWGRPPERQPEVHEAGYTGVVFQRCLSGCEGGSQSQIIEADIVVHPEPPERLSTEACLFATLLHEAGHFLGVPHLSSRALMAPVATSCEEELTAADRAALARLYGASEAAPVSE